MEDRAQGRTLCPPFVTSAYLRDPPREGALAIPQHLAEKCSPSHGRTSYCTVACQPGNARVVWKEHDISWCYSRENTWARFPATTANVQRPVVRASVLGTFS